MSTKSDFTLPQFFNKSFQERILNLEVFDSDTWVITFPRSGTTWTQEMVWLIGNDLDYSGAKEELISRFPEIEVTSLFDFSTIENKLNLGEHLTNSIGFVEKMKHPRFIKTHLPWCYLPNQIQNGSKKPKIVYVARNPKDVCNSYYKHNKLAKINEEPFEEFCDLFLQGKVMYAPYWKQVRSYWEKRHQVNILFLRYEDMIKDLPSVIRKVAKFLNKNFDDEDVKKLNNHLTFDSMKKNEAVNREKIYEEFKTEGFVDEGKFIRCGKIGDHKNAMSPEMIKKFDQWIAENMGDMKELYKL